MKEFDTVLLAQVLRLNARLVRLQTDVIAMQAANDVRAHRGEAQAYSERQFAEVGAQMADVEAQLNYIGQG